LGEVATTSKSPEEHLTTSETLSGAQMLRSAPQVECRCYIPGSGLVSGLVDLLDFGNPFEKISVRIFEIGEEHVPRPVTPCSVNPPGAVTQIDEEFRQLATARMPGQGDSSR